MTLTRDMMVMRTIIEVSTETGMLHAETWNPDAKVLPEGPTPETKVYPCVHRNGEIRREKCEGCGGHVQIRIYGCKIHAECAIDRSAVPNVCSVCPDRE